MNATPRVWLKKKNETSHYLLNLIPLSVNPLTPNQETQIPSSQVRNSCSSSRGDSFLLENITNFEIYLGGAYSPMGSNVKIIKLFGPRQKPTTIPSRTIQENKQKAFRGHDIDRNGQNYQDAVSCIYLHNSNQTLPSYFAFLYPKGEDTKKQSFSFLPTPTSNINPPKSTGNDSASSLTTTTTTTSTANLNNTNDNNNNNNNNNNNINQITLNSNSKDIWDKIEEEVKSLKCPNQLNLASLKNRFPRSRFSNFNEQVTCENNIVYRENENQNLKVLIPQDQDRPLVNSKVELYIFSYPNSIDSEIYVKPSISSTSWTLSTLNNNETFSANIPFPPLSTHYKIEREYFYKHRLPFAIGFEREPGKMEFRFDVLCLSNRIDINQYIARRNSNIHTGILYNCHQSLTDQELNNLQLDEQWFFQNCNEILYGVEKEKLQDQSTVKAPEQYDNSNRNDLFYGGFSPLNKDENFSEDFTFSYFDEQYYSSLLDQKLALAIEKGHVGVIENSKEKNDRTFLHYLAIRGLSKSMVAALNLYRSKSEKKFNSWLNAQDCCGFSALYIACDDDQYECVEALLSFGAGRELKSKNGKIAFDVISDFEIKELFDKIYERTPSPIIGESSEREIRNTFMEGRISVIEQIESSTVDFLRNSDPHGYGVHWDTIYVQMRLQNYLKDKKLSRKIFYTYLTKFKLNGFLVNGIQRGTYAAFDCADPETNKQTTLIGAIYQVLSELTPEEKQKGMHYLAITERIQRAELYAPFSDKKKKTQPADRVRNVLRRDILYFAQRSRFINRQMDVYSLASDFDLVEESKPYDSERDWSMLKKIFVRLNNSLVPYQADPEALNVLHCLEDLSFVRAQPVTKVREGGKVNPKTIVLLGTTGCGKSYLLNVLLRLMTAEDYYWNLPEHGAVVEQTIIDEIQSHSAFGDLQFDAKLDLEKTWSFMSHPTESEIQESESHVQIEETVEKMLKAIKDSGRPDDDDQILAQNPFILPVGDVMAAVTAFPIEVRFGHIPAVLISYYASRFDLEFAQNKNSQKFDDTLLSKFLDSQQISSFDFEQNIGKEPKIYMGNGKNLLIDRIFIRNKIREHCKDLARRYATEKMVIYLPVNTLQGGSRILDAPGIEDDNELHRANLNRVLKNAHLIWALSDKPLTNSKALNEAIRDSNILPRMLKEPLKYGLSVFLMEEKRFMFKEKNLIVRPEEDPKRLLAGVQQSHTSLMRIAHEEIEKLVQTDENFQDSAERSFAISRFEHSVSGIYPSLFVSLAFKFRDLLKKRKALVKLSKTSTTNISTNTTTKTTESDDEDKEEEQKEQKNSQKLEKQSQEQKIQTQIESLDEEIEILEQKLRFCGGLNLMGTLQKVFYGGLVDGLIFLSENLNKLKRKESLIENQEFQKAAAEVDTVTTRVFSSTREAQESETLGLEMFRNRRVCFPTCVHTLESWCIAGCKLSKESDDKKVQVDEMIECETCARLFHMICVKAKNSDEWHCPSCRSESKTSSPKTKSDEKKETKTQKKKKQTQKPPPPSKKKTTNKRKWEGTETIEKSKRGKVNTKSETKTVEPDSASSTRRGKRKSDVDDYETKDTKIAKLIEIQKSAKQEQKEENHKKLEIPKINKKEEKIVKSMEIHSNVEIIELD